MRKIKLKSVLKGSMFLLLLTVGFCYFSEVLLWKTSADINLYNGRHFYETEEHTIDVMFFGNSHCFCTINNAVLYENYGIASYNFSAGAQQIGTTYYFMKEALEYQSPKAMLVEISSFIDYEQSQGDVYRNALALRPGENYYKNIEYINSITDGRVGEVLDLALQWPITHTRYAELEEEDYHDYHYFQRGFRASFAKNEYGLPEGLSETGTVPLEEDVVFYLEQMLALAEEHETELIFFASPYIIGQEDQMIYNAVGAYLEEKGITFFNFATEENLAGIDYTTDIWNTGHVNVYGSEKVTRYLGEYLKRELDLPDRRGDEAYELWELDAKYFKRLEQENALVNANDTEAYFEGLKTLDNLCVITIEGDSSLALKNRLAGFGVPQDMIQQNDVFIFCEGMLAGTMKRGDARYYEEFQKKSVVITCPESGICTVNIGEPLPAMTEEGMNIYVYNEIDGRLVDIVGITESGAFMRYEDVLAELK